MPAKNTKTKKDNIEKKDKPPPKKRGRKPKKKVEQKDKPPPKKRGRKPKGGKIISKKDLQIKDDKKVEHNIILHLKCNSKDIGENNTILKVTDYDPKLENPISHSFNNSKLNNLQYEDLKSNYQNNELETKKNTIIKNPNILNVKEEKKEDVNESSIKEIWLKLDILKKKLKMNNVSDKKSACFWCTCSFDSPAIYIPSNYENDSYEVYGCFCTPQCAVSYLKKQKIDTSTLWERYSLLNNMYTKIYDYKRNIKPAPDPYYTLNKFYGNLSIQEYRKILKNERMYMIVDKPMTKILPELYEENNEIPNIYGNLLNSKKQNNLEYRLKRKRKNHTKNEILGSTFNFN
jgi:hypothetical protein